MPSQYELASIPATVKKAAPGAFPYSKEPIAIPLKKPLLKLQKPPPDKFPVW